MLANLAALHAEEERLRVEACALIAGDRQLELHVSVVANAMNLVDTFRMLPTDDEDMKALQSLGIRVFNCFGSSLKLALSGYWANSLLDMRFILEVVFLMDLLDGDRSLVATWRTADQKERKKRFSPFAVRVALDVRDGFADKKREEHYNLFSQHAAHPTLESMQMMRPRSRGGIQAMPFMDLESLRNILFEMARLAVHFGDVLDHFFFDTWVHAHEVRLTYKQARERWVAVNRQAIKI